MKEEIENSPYDELSLITLFGRDPETKSTFDLLTKNRQAYVLSRVEALASITINYDARKRVESYADYLRAGNAISEEDAAEYYKIPEQLDLVVEGKVLVPGSIVREWKTVQREIMEYSPDEVLKLINCSEKNYLEKKMDASLDAYRVEAIHSLVIVTHGYSARPELWHLRQYREMLKQHNLMIPPKSK